MSPSPTIPPLTLPTAETSYLQALTATITTHFSPTQLAGVYLFGSAAYSSYIPFVSDLDVAVIVSHSLERGVYESLVEKITHKSLNCPARKLELVIYREEEVRNPHKGMEFEVNFNTGREVGDDGM
jgi:hypothetical protein